MTEFDSSALRPRPAARILLLDPQGRVLLFRFVHTSGALAGSDYWATPGGEVEEGETFAQAAIRELWEETGRRVDDVGSEVGRRSFVLRLPTGEEVLADERFFVVRTESADISRVECTMLERQVMTEHRWWSPEDLAATSAQVFPENLADMLAAAARRR